MTIKERELERDYMRGGRGPVTIRFDGDDLAELPCHCTYDPKLCSEKGNRVLLVKSAEVKERTVHGNRIPLLPGSMGSNPRISS